MRCAPAPDFTKRRRSIAASLDVRLALRILLATAAVAICLIPSPCPAEERPDPGRSERRLRLDRLAHELDIDPVDFDVAGLHFRGGVVIGSGPLADKMREIMSDQVPQMCACDIKTPPLVCLSPRGKLTPDDLHELRIGATEEFPFPEEGDGGTVRLTSGSRVLYEVKDWSPTHFVNALKLGPDVVRAARSAKGKLRWGFYPMQGLPRTATIELVALSELQERSWQAVKKATNGLPEPERRDIRSQWWFGQGYYERALREAGPIPQNTQGSVFRPLKQATLRCLATAQRALLALDLRHSEPSRRVHVAMSYLPESIQRDLHRRKHGSGRR
jgi:hypothetical protein